MSAVRTLISSAPPCFSCYEPSDYKRIEKTQWHTWKYKKVINFSGLCSSPSRWNDIHLCRGMSLSLCTLISVCLVGSPCVTYLPPCCSQFTMTHERYIMSHTGEQSLRGGGQPYSGTLSLNKTWCESSAELGLILMTSMKMHNCLGWKQIALNGCKSKYFHVEANVVAFCVFCPFSSHFIICTH